MDSRLLLVVRAGLQLHVHVTAVSGSGIDIYWPRTQAFLTSCNLGEKSGQGCEIKSG